MRRRRRGSRNGIFIDLTSLLDVIFILLLVVLCGTVYHKQTNEEEIKAREESLKTAEAEAEKTANEYKDMVEMQKDLREYIWSASIIVPYEEDNKKKRTVKVIKDEEEVITISIEGNVTEEGYNTLKNDLSQLIEERKNQPVILTLNESDENILYRDENAIRKILDQLSHQYSNVYIKGKNREEQNTGEE